MTSSSSSSSCSLRRHRRGRFHPLTLSVAASLSFLVLFRPLSQQQPWGGFVVAATVQEDERHLNHQHRHLQEQQEQRGCGEAIGIVTVQDVRNAGRALLAPLVSPDLLERSLEIMFLSVVYDTTIVKLCGSCQSHADWYFYDRGGITFPGYHKTYCSANGVEFNENLSGLALLPRIPSTDSGSGSSVYEQLPNAVKLRTFLSLPRTNANVQSVPTVEFPSNFTNTNNSNDTSSLFTTTFLSTYLPGMVAAASGAVALFPDYPGTGSSSVDDNGSSSSSNHAARTIFQLKSYEQATAVSFLALQKHIWDKTGFCSALDMEAATIYGADDGAFAAVAATQVLQRFGVRSLTTFLAAGPLHLELVLQQSILSEDEVDTTATTPAVSVLDEWIYLSAFSFSSINSTGGVSNIASGEGYSLAAPEWQQPLKDVYGTKTGGNESTTTTASLPQPATTVLNADLVSLYKEYIEEYGIVNATSPCNQTIWGEELPGTDDTTVVVTNSSSGGGSVILGETTNVSSSGIDSDATMAICRAVVEASVYPLLLGQTDRMWAYNLSVCYSETDEVVSPLHYEHTSLNNGDKTGNLDVIQLQSLWNRYTQPLGLDALQVITGHDHDTTLQLCTVAPILFFTLQGHKPDNSIDHGNLMTPLSAEELARCVPPTLDGTNDDSNNPGPPSATSNTNPESPTANGPPSTPTTSSTSGGENGPSVATPTTTTDSGDPNNPPTTAASGASPPATTPSNAAGNTSSSSFSFLPTLKNVWAITTSFVALFFVFY